MKTLSMRAPAVWVDFLDDLHATCDGLIADSRSGIIREVVQKCAYLWLEAPYIATAAEAFVFVGGQGDMFFSLTQELLIQESRHRLPTRISMKPEKEREFEREAEKEREAGEEQDEQRETSRAAEKIRSSWLINHFTTWRGRKAEILDQQMDDLGITSKSCDLLVNTPQDSMITREILVGIENYVQRSSLSSAVTPEDLADDRASVSVHIPTLRLRAAVVVDLELFANNNEKRLTSQVDYEVRNGENALLRTKRYNSDVNSNRWHSGRHPRVSRRQEGPRNECLKMFRNFRQRIHDLAQGDVDGQPIVKIREHRERLLGIEQPKEFLFGLFEWPMPPVGLKVCLTWNKPDPLE